MQDWTVYTCRVKGRAAGNGKIMVNTHNNRKTSGYAFLHTRNLTTGANCDTLMVLKRKDARMNTDRRMALLIDADNVSPSYVKIIMDETTARGIVTYKRIYGDWTRNEMQGWKSVLLEYSLTPMQQYSYTTGKNSTDSALIIDAMDILYTGKVDGFCLVSSDSDFTKLAARLREAGMLVIGMGEKKTPRPFVTACNEFKFIDKIEKTARAAESEVHDEKKEPQKEPQKEPTSQTDLNSIRGTILQQLANFSDEEGWMMASRIGDVLTQRYPDFDVRNYGYKKLTSFLSSFSELELRTEEDRNVDGTGSVHTIYIRVRPSARRKR